MGERIRERERFGGYLERDEREREREREKVKVYFVSFHF